MMSGNERRHSGSNNNAMISVSAALGIDGKAHLDFLKHRFQLKRNNKHVNGSNQHLCLNSLRLDAECLEYLANHFEECDLSHRPSSILLRKVILLDSTDEEGGDHQTLNGAFERLMRSLSCSLNKIQIIDREDDRKIQPNQAAVILHSLKYVAELKTLNISGVTFQNDPNIGSAIKQTLRQQRCTLNSLILHRCEGDNSTWSHLSEALPSMENLSHVSIRNCSVGKDFQEALVHALARCSASEVGLQEFFGHASLPLLSHLLREKRNLTALNLSNNVGLLHYKDETEMKDVAAALARAPMLEKLSLRFCSTLSTFAVVSIFQALEENHHVTELDFSGCIFTTADWTTHLPRIQGLRVLRVPQDLRSPRVSVPLLGALKTNTSLGLIGGEGRWRHPSAHVQHLLRRNQLIWIAQHEKSCTQTRLWPHLLTHMVSNRTVVQGGEGGELEASPVYAFLCTHLAAVLPPPPQKVELS